MKLAALWGPPVRMAVAVRRPLAALGLVCLTVFAVFTVLAATQPYLAFDIPLTRWVQSVDWGPLHFGFGVVDWLEGVRELVMAGVLAIVVFAVNRRATALVIACALSGGAYALTEFLISQPRPSSQLVHVIRHTVASSYPSGHAVFFCWFLAMIVLCLVRPFLPRAAQVVAWVAVSVLLAVVCIGRVYYGEHWPSDVLAGLALGAGWTLLALSVRRLSSPVLERHAEQN